MIVADILMWFLLIMGTYVIFISYWLAAHALFPELTDRCRQRIKNAPVRQALIGLAWTIPCAAGGIALLNLPNPLLKFLGATVVLLLILAGLIGSSALAAQIGYGLANPSDQAQPWRRVLRGGMVLGLTFVFPLIGWLLILPLSLVIGIGALFASLPGSASRRPTAVLEPRLTVGER
jgi:hypothetical protein